MERTIFIAKEHGENLKVEGFERGQVFKEIIASIGYGDPQRNGDYAKSGFIVVGWQPDDIFHVIGEWLGEFDDLGDELIDFKDAYRIDRTLTDMNYRDFRNRLLSVDGLCEYQTYGNSVDGYMNPPNTWDFFVSRAMTTQLIGVDKRILQNFLEAMNRTTSMIENGELLIAPWCKQVSLLRRDTIREVQFHPLAKALTYAAVTLGIELESDFGSSDEPLGTSYYKPRL